MRTPSVDMKDLAANIQKIKTDSKDLHGSWPDADVTPELWATMLDLIYTGHRIVAWQFLEEAWPLRVAGKDAFKREFLEQLKESPYWQSIKQMGS
jgi:hypothetical protein